MLKRIAVAAVLAGVAAVIITSLPDIRRYLKIRNM